MKRALITGASGFVGNHLSELLLGENIAVFGADREKRAESRAEFIPCNITVFEDALKAVEKSNPDVVFHLAAQSSAAVSWDKPGETFSANVVGTFNVLEAVKRKAQKARVVFVSSSECYGLVEEDALPLKESSALKPHSPYGLTKKIGEEMCNFYSRAHDLECRIVRPFNMVGPGQRENFVIGDWTKQAAEIALRKKAPKIVVGNIDVHRDFLDVRDAVKAFVKVAGTERKENVFNVCSGKAVHLKSVLETIIGLSQEKISFEVDQSKIRKGDTRKCYGSNELLKKTGWKQEIMLEQTLRDSFEHWKRELKKN